LVAVTAHRLPAGSVLLSGRDLVWVAAALRVSRRMAEGLARADGVGPAAEWLALCDVVDRAVEEWRVSGGGHADVREPVEVPLSDVEPIGVREAAARLFLSPRQVRRLAAAQVLPPLRMPHAGRPYLFDPDVVTAYRRQREQEEAS
jgi:hypothetical protein